MRRLKVLLSAYACEPTMGSEPGVGWNLAREMARRHDVWVLTRANNRPVIEAELEHNPIPGLRFAYYDLPPWVRRLKRGQRGLQPYYYLWQLGAYRVARQLHREVGFDLAHHVTFVSYWKPSLMTRLPVPFVWGPVGGGVSAPKAFWSGFGLRGWSYEAARELARWVGERDPLVRTTALRSDLVLATTGETADRLRKMGVENVGILLESGLTETELERLGRYSSNGERPVRFVSVGRLLHLKGFHLGLRAFAESGLSNAEYWIMGDGPERERLRLLAKRLGISDQVTFWGWVPRVEALDKLGECDVLVHPSLHDSGGWACLEAMAAGRPVICLDLGGPGVQVTRETGFKVPAIKPKQAVSDLASAMSRLALDPKLRSQMAEAGRERTRQTFSWEKRASRVAESYATLIGGSPDE